MIIIVEGPDGAGKTTLIDKLLKSSCGAVYHHFGAPASAEEAANYYQVYADTIKACTPDALHVFDRSWYSDMVYGPVMRGKCEMTQTHADMLAAMCIAHGGAMIIYCTAPVSTLWQRCKARGETYITDVAKLAEIAKLYPTVMRENVSYLPVVRYDTSVRW